MATQQETQADKFVNEIIKYASGLKLGPKETHAVIDNITEKLQTKCEETFPWPVQSLSLSLSHTHTHTHTYTTYNKGSTQGKEEGKR